MDKKRAIITGIALWVLIFFEVSILMFGFNLKPGNTFYISHYILLIVLAALFSLFYFKEPKVKKGPKQGLSLGLTYMVIGLILDGVITVPLFVKDYGFFLDPYLWLGIVIMILTTVIVSIKAKSH